VVSEILVPFGTPITSRPPIISESEAQAQYQAKRSEKLERRRLRRSAAQGSESAIEKLRIMEMHEAARVAEETKVKKAAGKAQKTSNESDSIIGARARRRL
jgi:small subunit ribosomal protein S17